MNGFSFSNRVMCRSLAAIAGIIAGLVPGYGETVDFGYCGSEIIGYGNGETGVWYAGAMKVDAATATAFKGCGIESVTVGMGQGARKNISVFISYGLDEEPVLIKDGKLTDYNYFSTIALDEPWTIEDGKEFYVGYRYYSLGAKSEPIGFDGNINYADKGGAWLSVASDEAALSSAWQDCSSTRGNIDIRFSISGDLPAAYVYPTEMALPGFGVPGSEIPLTMTVANFGGENVETLDLSYSAGAEENLSVTCKLSSPLKPGERGSVTFNLAPAESSMDLVINASLPEVNGNANGAALRQLTSHMVYSADVYQKAFVIEDYTGNTCGYCPIGYLALGYLNEKYADFEKYKIIGIAIHNYSKVDPTYCVSYEPFIQAFNLASAPASEVNRSTHVYPTKNNLEYEYLNMFVNWAPAKIELECTLSEDRSKVTAIATTEFAADEEDADYGVAFVLTEDNVGPYPQDNYYNDDPNMPEYYQKGNPMLMKFNEVARDITVWNGAPNSVPTSIEAKENYVYEEEVSLGNCGAIEQTHLIALLIDRRTNEIVNADMLDLANVLTGVAEVSSSLAVYGGNGRIYVNGDYSSLQLFTIDGMSLGTHTGGTTFTVPAGVIVARATLPGGATRIFKVMAR